MINLNKLGYLRVAAVTPPVKLANPEANAATIIRLAESAAASGASVAVFPELSITGYTCADLFHNRTLLDASRNAVFEICKATASLDLAVIVGSPWMVDDCLYNCAVVIFGGKIEGIVPKTYLPNYNEFYEKRWFHSGARKAHTQLQSEKCGFGTAQLFEICGVKFGIELCEDLWAPIPPSIDATLRGAEVIFNLSASDDQVGKYDYLRSLVVQQSARCLCGYVYAGAGRGESTTDLVFDGKGIIAERGTIIAEAECWTGEPTLTIADIDIESIRRDRRHITTFADCADICSAPDFTTVNLGGGSQTADTLLRYVDPLPFVPSDAAGRENRCREIVNIQTSGLRQRLETTNTKNLVIGISGGLDSTLALLVAVDTFKKSGLDLKGIIAVTMPGFGTTGRTYRNALTLMETLGVTIREIPIAEAVHLHFRDIGHDPSVTDVTYENSQARERTQILMDVANQVGGMVLGTGDLSELALGWATYNGDHMSMYGVNAGVPKTLVKYLVGYFADTTENAALRAALLDVIDTPISPELTPADDKGDIAQKTEDLVGPYELHDFFLYYMLRYGFTPERIWVLALTAFPERDRAEIKHWMRTFFRRFFSQQFKRSCLPDGPKVGSVCLSPRGDWRMPSDASSAIWLKKIDALD